MKVLKRTYLIICILVVTLTQANEEDTKRPSDNAPAPIIKYSSGSSQKRRNLYNYRHVCKPDFLRLGNGCYYFSKGMDTWMGAHFNCRGMESHLMVVESAWEDLVIRRHLNRRSMTRLNRWLGGIYDWESMEWVWGSSGEMMLYKGFLTRNKDPYSPRWKCVFTSPSLYYRWNYTKCTRRLHYICEAPFTRVPIVSDNHV